MKKFLFFAMIAVATFFVSFNLSYKHIRPLFRGTPEQAINQAEPAEVFVTIEPLPEPIKIDQNKILDNYKPLKPHTEISFQNVREAVSFALLQASYLSTKLEIGGTIYKKGSKYYISTLVSSGDRDSVVIPDKHEDASYKPVADFHTHPCMPYDHYVSHFSPNDVMMGVKHKRVQYMLNLCNGNIKEWDEKIDDISDYITIDGQFVTGGRIIGNIGD